MPPPVLPPIIKQPQHQTTSSSSASSSSWMKNPQQIKACAIFSAILLVLIIPFIIVIHGSSYTFVSKLDIEYDYSNLENPVHEQEVVVKTQEQREEQKAKLSSRKVMEPLKCKKSASLDTSPYLLKKYGNIEEGGWCELITKQNSEEAQVVENFNYRSVFMERNKNSPSASNGATYVDYRASSDGKNWPYLQCPVKHKVRCHSAPEKLAQKFGSSARKSLLRKKTKALVVFIVPTSADAYQHHLETKNLNHFIEHGLISGETALFDEVDFVFAKIQLRGEKTEAKFVDCGDFAEASSIRDKLLLKKLMMINSSSTTTQNNNNKKINIRFLMVPKAPCDICAHAKILSYLGIFDYKKERTRIRKVANAYTTDRMRSLFGKPSDDNVQDSEGQEEPYSQMIFLNSGTRGPFFFSGDDDDKNESQENHDHHPKTTWVDFVSMAGRRKIPNPRLGFFNHPIVRKNTNPEQEDCPIHVASGMSISWEQQMHIQTMFISAPFELMRTRYFSLFTNTCAGDKVGCIVRGEVRTSEAVLDYSGSTAVYSLAKQMYVQDLKGPDDKYKYETYFWPRKNPSYTWYDPCKAVFVKNAGHLSCSAALKPDLLYAMTRLTQGQDAANNNNNNKTTRRVDYYDFVSIQKMFGKRSCDWKF